MEVSWARRISILRGVRLASIKGALHIYFSLFVEWGGENNTRRVVDAITRVTVFDDGKAKEEERETGC